MARRKRSKSSGSKSGGGFVNSLGRGGIPNVPKPAATVGTVTRPPIGPPGPTTSK